MTNENLYELKKIERKLVYLNNVLCARMFLRLTRKEHEMLAKQIDNLSRVIRTEEYE